MTGPVTRRGEVWWVAFDPAVGGEIRKSRPAVVVSNNRSNRILNRIQVVPLTSRADRVRDTEVLIVMGGKRSKALANQIRTVAVERILNRVGEISATELAAIEAAIRVQLEL